MRECKDKYMPPVIIEYPNGSTTKVYIPILTEAEQARRMEQVRRAATALMLEQERIKAEQEKQNGTVTG